MSQFKILISDSLHPHAIEWLQQQPDIDVQYDPAITPEALRKALGNFHALIVRSRTKIRTEELQEAGNLKVIGRAGTGLDNINVDEAKAQGIAVLNSPGANANAVAELTMGLLLAVARNLPTAFASTEKLKQYGWELRDKTLGIIGLGQIGGRVARLAYPFGMTLVGFDVLEDIGPKDVPLRRVSYEELLQVADVVTIHVPLLDATKQLVDQNAVTTMKNGVTILNTARADIVDETAVLDGLNSGKINAYAADAITSQTLREHEKVIATPHIGAQTAEAQLRAGLEIAERVTFALRGTH